MTEPAIPRYVLLGARPEGAFRLARRDEAPILADVAAGHSVHARGDVPVIQSLDGHEQTLEAAVASGVVKLARTGNATVMRHLFQGWVRDQVWKSVMRALAQRGENVRDWSLTVRDDALLLRHAPGDLVAKYAVDGWWRVLDPDRAADIAARLTGLVGLKTAA